MSDEVNWLRQCAGWLRQLDGGGYPPAGQPAPVRRLARPGRRYRQPRAGHQAVIDRIAADVDELARRPAGPGTWTPRRCYCARRPDRRQRLAGPDLEFRPPLSPQGKAAVSCLRSRGHPAEGGGSRRTAGHRPGIPRPARPAGSPAWWTCPAAGRGAGNVSQVGRSRGVIGGSLNGLGSPARAVMVRHSARAARGDGRPGDHGTGHRERDCQRAAVLPGRIAAAAGRQRPRQLGRSARRSTAGRASPSTTGTGSSWPSSGSGTPAAPTASGSGSRCPRPDRSNARHARTRRNSWRRPDHDHFSARRIPVRPAPLGSPVRREREGTEPALRQPVTTSGTLSLARP